MPSGGSSCSGADPGKSYRDRLFFTFTFFTFAFALDSSFVAYSKVYRVLDREIQLVGVAL